MSVNPTNAIHHSLCEYKFLELEAGFKNHEELLKSIRNLPKQVIIFS